MARLDARMEIRLYAFGAESPWREASVSFLRAAAARELAAVTSVETLQEIIHRYRSIRRFGELEAAYRGVLVAWRLGLHL